MKIVPIPVIIVIIMSLNTYCQNSAKNSPSANFQGSSGNNKLFSTITIKPTLLKVSKRFQFSSYENKHFGNNEEIQNSQNKTKKNIPRDIYGAGKIFVKDFVQVYTSPFKWDKKNIYWFSGFVLSTALIFKYDQEILNAIQRNRNALILSQLLEIGNFFEPVGHMGVMNKYYFATFGVGYIFNVKPIMTPSGQIIQSFFTAGAFKNVSALLVGRKRPFNGEGPYSFSFNGGTSFPSGHALNIFQLATVLSYHIRFLPFQIFAYSIAVAVTLQRIDSDNHWPSDVYFAAVFGTWVARNILKFHELRNTSISPQISPSNKYYGLSMSLKL